MNKKKISPINEEFDFKLLVTIARKNTLWFMLFILISILTAQLILRYTQSIYEATAIIQLSEEDRANTVLDKGFMNGYKDNTSKIASSIELIKSKIILQRVLKRLPLQISYFSKGEILTNELYKQSPVHVEVRLIDSSIVNTPIVVDFIDSLNYQITIPKGGTDEFTSTFSGKNGKWLKTPYGIFNIYVTSYPGLAEIEQDIRRDAFFFRINDPNIESAKIARDLTVVPLNPEAKTIQIKFREKNAIKVSDIVNTIAQEFIKYNLEKNSEVADRIIDFIDNTITSIELQLNDSENSIEEFKKSNKIFKPDMNADNLVTQLTDYQNELFAVDHEISLYSKLRKDVSGNNDIGSFLLSLSGRLEKSEVIQQLSKLQELIEKRDEIRVQATENSEVFKSISLKLKSQQDLIINMLLNEEALLKARKSQRLKEVVDLESQLGKIPSKQATYGRLNRLFTINEKFYSLLLEKKAEFSIKRAGYIPEHVVLQEAKGSMAPVSPNRPLILSACLVCGILAAFALLITRYLLYNEINALEEVGQYTDAALLGIIPKYKREIPISQLLVDKNPKSVISEAFRSVRTNLQFISNTDQAKILAVTSTISGEGKTFNAINLAGVIAFSGLKVVILDLDMRKPKIHLGFNVENNHGISTLLIGKDDPEKCIFHSSLANLHFITAGPIPPNPAELIINPRMEKLLEYLKGIYDIIIIDLPPVGIVSDGIPILQKADYPIYILRANYSKKMFIAQINKLIAENKVKNLSIILNGIEMSRLRYGYGYGYSYGYGYGYGYSYGYGYYEDDEKPKNLFGRLKDMVFKPGKL